MRRFADTQKMLPATSFKFLTNLLGWPCPAALAGCFAVVAGATLYPSAVPAQQGSTVPPSATRPFPIVRVQVGDVPLELPRDWVETKFISILPGQGNSITFVNANDHQPPRSTHFDVPPLAFFNMQRAAKELVERNLRERKIALEQQSERAPDSDGFRRWKTGEYVLSDTPYARPLGQPLIVKCAGSLRLSARAKAGFKIDPNEQRCGVSFYWTLNTGVRYDFYDTDVPKSRWAELDQRVLALLNFLDGRKDWPGGN